MDFKSTIPECDDEEIEGRTLDDGEYAHALLHRDDIFLIDHEKRFHYIEAATLAVGMAIGIWLNTMPIVKTVSDFHQIKTVERTARLLRKQIATATVPEEGITKEEKKNVPYHPEAGIRKPQVAREHKAAMVPKIDNSRAHLKIDSLAPEVKIAVPQLYSVVQGKLAEEKPGKSVTEDDSSLISEGNSNKKQNHVIAFEAFKNVLRHDPHNVPALAGLGDVFLYTGFLDSAASFYNAALAINPRNAAVRNGLGSVHYFVSTLAANPRYAARMHISDPARYIREQYDSAVAEYTEAFSIDSSHVGALTNRGVIRDIHGDHAAAIADYTRAIKINPSFADAYSKRAETFKSLGKFKDAVADYTAAIRLDSNSYEFDPTLHFANAYFGRGVVRYKTGEIDKAIADFDSALALEPKHSLAIINKAVALSDKKEYDSAIAGYTRAIALLSPFEYDGAQALAFVHRGNAYKTLGKYDEAISDYSSTIGFPRLAAKSSWRIAECYALKKDRDNAIAWVKKSISFGFTDFKTWKHDRDLSFISDDKEFRDLIKGH